MITAELGRLNWLNPNFVLGIILIGFVLLLPSGILPAVKRVYEMLPLPNRLKAPQRRSAQ